jgi:preprotein translocase subunit YajC
VTSGGMIATVHTIEDDSILAEVDSNVKVRFIKSAVVDVNPNKVEKKA